MASGAGVCGLLYPGGVILATDTLISYGSQAKWPHCERVYAPTSQLAIAAGGLVPDFQHLCHHVDKITFRDDIASDGTRHSARDLFEAIGNVFYNRRQKSSYDEALYSLSLIAGGWDKRAKAPFLGIALHDGNLWYDDYAATDVSMYFTKTALREWAEANPFASRTRESCEAALIEVMTLAYAKICTAGSQVQLTHVGPDGVNISEPVELKPRWNYALWNSASTTYQ